MHFIDRRCSINRFNIGADAELTPGRVA